MGRDLSELLRKSLDTSRLELLYLLAFQASALQMPLYLVGGVVRDMLLGRAVKDFDLVVEGNSADFAEYIVRKFGGKILIHSKFKTATWVLNESTFKRLNVPTLDVSNAPLSFDLISARSEAYEYPGALPTVRLSGLADDLRRRDFTVNAMAIRLDGDHFGELFDPLSGERDLESGLIRVLYDRSFMDDPTRILRAVRYAGRYGFKIAPETVALINTDALKVLNELSGERLRHEFDLIFEEKQSEAMIMQLEGLGVLRRIHPALQVRDFRPPLEYQLTDDLQDLVVPDLLSFHQTLAWVVWLISLPTSDIEMIAKRLAFPTVLINVAMAASKIHQTPFPSGSKISEKTFYLETFPALAVYAAWTVASAEQVRQALGTYLTEWRKVKPYTTGYTLQSRGLAPGPRFKEILTRLRAAWLDGEVKSEEGEVKFLSLLLPKD